MGSIKVVIEDELLRKFKEEAMKKFGYTRGAFSIAAREAFIKWLNLEGGREKGIEDFKKALREAAGVWEEESGYRYVKKVRRESEKRLKRLGL
jgi:hypothetical protein